jgi:hypothetical protein
VASPPASEAAGRTQICFHDYAWAKGFKDKYGAAKTPCRTADCPRLHDAAIPGGVYDRAVLLKAFTSLYADDAVMVAAIKQALKDDTRFIDK